MSATETIDDTWVHVGPLHLWVRGTGRAVLIEGRQIAVFRLDDDTVLAVDNRDPFTGAQVLARGIVGNAGEIVKVASPLLKQCFDLTTGACLDDPDVAIATHEARVADGAVHVRPSDADEVTTPAA